MYENCAIVATIVLRNGEGKLVIRVDPSHELEGDNLRLSWCNVLHEPSCNLPMRFKELPGKNVFFCQQGCGLRFELPADVKTIGLLKAHFRPKMGRI